MKKDKELRQKLAARFDDFEAEPRPETWENIRLAVQKKRRRRAAFFLWLSAGVLLLGGGGLLLFSAQKRRAEDIRPRQAVVKPAAIARAGAALPATPVLVKAPTSLAVPSEEAEPNSPATPVLPAISNVKHLRDKWHALRPFNPTPGPSPLGRGAVDQTVISAPKWVEYAVNSTSPLPVGEGSGVGLNEQGELSKTQNTPLYQTRKCFTLETAVVLPPEIAIPPASTPGIPRKREQGLILGMALHSAYQLMQGQQVGDKSAGNIGLLPGFDGRRLGLSVAAGYRLPLGRRGDVQVGAAYFNLPLRASYDLLSGHQTQVNVQSGGDYTIAPAIVGHVSSEKRLQALGLSLEGGYAFRVLGLPTRAYAGGEIRAVFPLRRPGIWGHAGWEIALGRSGLSVGPFLDYQLGAVLSDDGFLKTRLYAVGLGARMALTPGD